MKKVIDDYVGARDSLLKYFDCNDDYYIKPVIDCDWCVKQEGSVAFLSYWRKGQPRVDAVIAKKDGIPIIFRKDDYSMIIAIDCIKIAFILDSSKGI